MTTSVLPISNIINVTVTTTPSGLAERNVNSLGLFTTESPSNLNPFGTYVSAQQVASDYGTASVTAQMANAIFAQTPNILSGNGRLVIIPLLSSVSATSGDFTTADISANIANLIAVTDGDLRATIDGVNYDLTNVNLTGATNLTGINTILNNLLVNAICTVENDNSLMFQSKKVGADADVVLTALPSGSGTDLAAAGLLNVSAGSETSGTDASGETIQDAVTRTAGQVGYVPIITNLDMEDDVIEALSDFIQPRDNMFLHHVSSTVDVTASDGIVNTVTDSGNTRTRLLLYTESLAEANLFKAAYSGRAYSVDFFGAGTSQTLQLKQLATITPDSGITQTLYNQAQEAGADVYVSFEGVPSIESTGGNDFFDNPYNDLALKFALETAGFNYLRQTNTKVPQTEQGMNGLKTEYANVLERFVRSGVVAPGTWTSSETFGNPDIFRENISNSGYYIFSVPITQQAAVQREARQAPLVQIGVKRAGAIHRGNVLVLVND